jgi:hypothetical protein
VKHLLQSILPPNAEIIDSGGSSRIPWGGLCELRSHLREYRWHGLRLLRWGRRASRTSQRHLNTLLLCNICECRLKTSELRTSPSEAELGRGRVTIHAFPTEDIAEECIDAVWEKQYAVATDLIRHRLGHDHQHTSSFEWLRSNRRASCSNRLEAVYLHYIYIRAH